ncbi:MAG TPA: helix-turn-helix transcriptional regulator [Candidatus Limnocylindria bacterium]|nr:helix-turn-helix transcriptional regulator [Candidatus Limnocylindria bacterium]
MGYQEADVSGEFRVLEIVEVIGTPPSRTTEQAFHTLGWQNPMHCRLHARDESVLRLSDLLSRRQRGKLEYHHAVWRPHGVDDALRAWLPAPPGRARSIYLERSGKNYTDRERTLFQLLRLHLARMRINAESRRRVDRSWSLSPREAEVLGWVALGRTNAEIAEALFISPLTVRTHLERIFEKLDVSTRTAAAAYARSGAGATTDGALMPAAPHRVAAQGR